MRTTCSALTGGLQKANKREHDGTIITDAPNLMWATDGKKFWIEGLGRHWFFGVRDHFNDEIISWHIAKKGNCFCSNGACQSCCTQDFWDYRQGKNLPLEFKNRKQSFFPLKTEFNLYNPGGEAKFDYLMANELIKNYINKKSQTVFLFLFQLMRGRYSFDTVHTGKRSLAVMPLNIHS